jgi:uncharacterized protein (TIGR03067 family)
VKEHRDEFRSAGFWQSGVKAAVRGPPRRINCRQKARPREFSLPNEEHSLMLESCHARGGPAVRRVLPLIAVLCLAFAPAPFPKRAVNDLKQLQGMWVLSFTSYSGKPARVTDLRWIVSGNKLTIAEEGSIHHWTFTLNPAPSTKEVDMRTPSGEKAGDLLLKAIYTVDRDTLKVCYIGNQWAVRPKNMSGAGHFLLVFKKMNR